MAYLWAPDDAYRAGFEAAKAAVDRVVTQSTAGVLADKGQALYVAARYGPGEGRVVEIGSAFGRSAIYLASGTRDARRGRVWCVDPHTEYWSREAFLWNVAAVGLAEWVVPVMRTSREAREDWDGSPVRLLFVDGDHSHSAVRDDIALWVPLVVAGGLVFFDDYQNMSGVERAVGEFLHANGYPQRMRGDMAWVRVRGQ